jgi:hypothetical protein
MSSELVRLAREVRATGVRTDDDSIAVELDDGRTLTVPILWFPRLAHGTADERAHWELLGAGEGIHWPDLDEDIEVEALLLGWKSSEGQESLDRWLRARSNEKASA